MARFWRLDLDELMRAPTRRETRRVSIQLGARDETGGARRVSVDAAAHERVGVRDAARLLDRRRLTLLVWVAAGFAAIHFFNVGADAARDVAASGPFGWVRRFASNPAVRAILKPDAGELAIMIVALPLLWKALPPGGRLILAPVIVQTIYLTISQFLLAPSMFAINEIATSTVNALRDLRTR